MTEELDGSERVKQSLFAVQDVTKQLLTLATGIIGITITFLKDLIKDTASGLRFHLDSNRLDLLRDLDHVRDSDAACGYRTGRESKSPYVAEANRHVRRWFTRHRRDADRHVFCRDCLDGYLWLLCL
jgi:hypothetical protein